MLIILYRWAVVMKTMHGRIEFRASMSRLQTCGNCVCFGQSFGVCHLDPSSKVMAQGVEPASKWYSRGQFAALSHKHYFRLAAGTRTNLTLT